LHGGIVIAGTGRGWQRRGAWPRETADDQKEHAREQQGTQRNQNKPAQRLPFPASPIFPMARFADGTGHSRTG